MSHWKSSTRVARKHTTEKTWTAFEFAIVIPTAPKWCSVVHVFLKRNSRFGLLTSDPWLSQKSESLGKLNLLWNIRISDRSSNLSLAMLLPTNFKLFPTFLNHLNFTNMSSSWLLASDSQLWGGNVELAWTTQHHVTYCWGSVGIAKEFDSTNSYLSLGIPNCPIDLKPDSRFP